LTVGAIAGVNVGGVEDLVLGNGRPEGKVTASLTWNLGRSTSGWYSSDVSDFYDTNATFLDSDRYWIVDGWLTHNLCVQYQLPRSGLFGGTRIRVGARNIFNEDPSLADDRFGFSGSVHSNRGRWWHASIRKSFRSRPFGEGDEETHSACGDRCGSAGGCDPGLGDAGRGRRAGSCPRRRARDVPQHGYAAHAGRGVLQRSVGLLAGHDDLLQ